MTDTRTLSERAALAMGWERLEETTDRRGHYWKKADGSLVRCSGWRPEHDANDSLEFAEWAEREHGVEWLRYKNGTIQATGPTGVHAVGSRPPAFARSVTKAILSALEEQS